MGGAFGAQTIGMDPTAAGAVIIAGAATGGALTSTISGSDPGMGALFAAGGAALSIGAAYAYEASGEQAQVELGNDLEDAIATYVDEAGRESPNDEEVLVAATFEFGTQEAADAFAEAAEFCTPGVGLVRSAERLLNGLRIGKTLTDKQAILRLRRGQDVHSSSRAAAKQLQKKASGGAIKDNAHRKGFFDHFHGRNRSGGHTFYGKPKF